NRTETRKQVARPATIANGRRRPPLAPPASTIGSTGRTQGEIAVIRPATNASATATASMRPLFGRASLLGSLRVRLVLGGGLAAVGRARVDLGRTLRGRLVAGVGGGLLGRRLARRLRVASLLAPPPAARARRRSPRACRAPRGPTRGASSPAACSRRPRRGAPPLPGAAARARRRRASPRSLRGGGRASWRARRAGASPPGTRRSPCGRAPCGSP